MVETSALMHEEPLLLLNPIPTIRPTSHADLDDKLNAI